MKILLGISGGVDSAYAAYKLKSQGHEVEGAVIKMHCHTELDAAREAAESIGIPLHIIDATEAFDSIIKENFATEYAKGRTPNPCIICNEKIKFGVMLDFALENGFDGKLAVSGGSVSGGQRQRIVLTRELLKNRPVLLLDEPTSALDAASALDMQQKLLNLFPGVTKLMITHDLRLLSQADHVIFLENGRVADSGSPEQLMERCPDYRDLVLCDEEVSV